MDAIRRETTLGDGNLIEHFKQKINSIPLLEISSRALGSLKRKERGRPYSG
jgi:hypothetical protein